jgi:hypothetical protein
MYIDNNIDSITKKIVAKKEKRCPSTIVDAYNTNASTFRHSRTAISKVVPLKIALVRK